MTAPAAATDPEPSPAGVAAAVFAGFILLAVVNAVAIAGVVPRPAAGLGLRAAHLFFDAAETLAVGGVVATVVGGFRCVRLPPRVTYAIAFVAVDVLVYIVIGAYLSLQSAHAVGGSLHWPIFINDFALLGALFVGVPVGAWRLARDPRPAVRFAPTVAGVLLIIADQVPFRDDYFGIHCLAAFGATLVAGPPLARPLLRFAGTLPGKAGLAFLGLLALAGLAVVPDDAVRQQLFRQPCALGPWVFARTIWRPPSLHSPVTPPPSPWLLDRSQAPPVPPTKPPLLPQNPVVVLITIDALRAEALYDPAHDAMLPTFSAMKRDGVVFTHAETPGAQTPTSIATIFSGRYFSELRWGDFGEGADRYPYPATDTSPRFPELLAAHGVTTLQEAAFVFLVNRFGVVRGFREENMFGHTRSASPAKFVMGAMLDRLNRVKDEPVFFYAHIGEPHGPYVYGQPGAPAHDRYMAAVVEADRQVGRIEHALATKFPGRWALLIGADHGEAFGEHDQTDHSKSLYEELLHVPLLMRSPAWKARRVDERVGLVDLGPTILDLFGVDTPATFNGQSLVPFLAGGTVALTRPLLAEGRLAKEYTQQDGLKVIDDPRKKTVEVYDLNVDPGETRNLFDVDPHRSDAALAVLRAFYATHALSARDPSYEAPYKP